MVENVLPRVCDVATREVDALSVNDRFRDAVELLIRSDRSMLPVLDGEGKLHSVFSHRRDVSRFLFGFDVVPLLSRMLTWSDLLQLPGGAGLGRAPESPELRGQLRLALGGDRSWSARIERDDVLVCGDISLALGLPPERFPRWIVLVSEDPPPEAQVRAANERSSFVMQYRHPALDFLFALMSQVRVGSLNLDTGPCVGEFDFLHDIREVVLSTRHALPVLDGQGALVGLLSRSDLAASPRRRVILIDHFESSQAVSGIEHAEILEIVDHHRVGDLQTSGPVRVECRPFGSSCTIVALRFFEAGLDPDRPTATLLLGGMMADTLVQRSPTTTAVDREVAQKLAGLIGVEVEEFGREVLRAGDDLLTADPAKIWNRDQKVYSVRNRSFAVAQLETVSLEDLPPERLEAFREQLERDFRMSAHLATLLVLTDVLKGDSWVAACESPLAAGLVSACFGNAHPRPGWTLARGVVSRKKQIVPPLMRALAEMGR